MELEMVEALAIHTNDPALTDKGHWVHLVDDVEDLTRLTLLCQDEKHLDAMAGIESLGIKHGHSTVRLLVDAAGYLLVMT